MERAAEQWHLPAAAAAAVVKLIDLLVLQPCDRTEWVEGRGNIKSNR